MDTVLKNEIYFTAAAKNAITPRRRRRRDVRTYFQCHQQRVSSKILHWGNLFKSPIAQGSCDTDIGKCVCVCVENNVCICFCISGHS